jgi:hypothetical protein
LISEEGEGRYDVDDTNEGYGEGREGTEECFIGACCYSFSCDDMHRNGLSPFAKKDGGLNRVKFVRIVGQDKDMKITSKATLLTLPHD